MPDDIVDERAVEVPKIPCQEFFEAVKDLSQERISGQTETSGQDWPSQRTVDLAQIMEEKFEVHKIVFPERILENDCATGDCREKWDVLQLRDGRTRVQIGVVKAPGTASQDRRLQRTVERSSARMCEQIGVIEVSMNCGQVNFETVKMPQIAEETVGVVGLAPRERVPQQTAESLMPQVLEETVEAVT